MSLKRRRPGQELLNLLDRSLRRRTNYFRLSVQMGTDRHFIQRRIAGDRDLAVDDLLLALDAIPYPRDVYFREVLLGSGPTAPQDVLRLGLEPESRKPDAFLVGIGMVLDQLKGRVLPPRGPLADPEPFATIDCLRHVERLPAKKQLEAHLRELLAPVEAGLEPEPELVGRLVEGLGILAAIHRLGGSRNDAAKALIHAFDLCGTGQTCALGSVYKRASYLLRDFFLMGEALDFNRQAFAIFAVRGDRKRLLQLQIERGQIEIELRRERQALEIFRAILEEIENEAPDCQFAVFKGIAVCQTELGDLREASHFLAEAKRLANPNDRRQSAYLLHLEGDVSRRSRNEARARALYLQSARIFEELAETVQALLVLIDLAQLERSLKNRSGLIELSRILFRLAPGLGTGLPDDSALLALVRELMSGSCSEESLLAASVEVKNSGRPTARIRKKGGGRPKRVPNPPG
jgi:tetratricopeptide (TPR) repeat protein